MIKKRIGLEGTSTGKCMYMISLCKMRIVIDYVLCKNVLLLCNAFLHSLLGLIL